MTTLDQLTTTDVAKELTINENFATVAYAGAFGPRPQAHSGLTWAWYGGEVYADGAWRTVANSTSTLTASTTNYLELDINKAAPTVDVNTSGWTAGKIPLWEIVTGGSGVSTEEDRRSYGLYKDDVNDLAYSGTMTPDLEDGHKVIVGVLTGSPTMNAPTNGYKGDIIYFSFTQDVTGSRTITWNSAYKKAADGAGTGDQVAATSFMYDGTNWIQLGPAIVWYT